MFRTKLVTKGSLDRVQPSLEIHVTYSQRCGQNSDTGHKGWQQFALGCTAPRAPASPTSGIGRWWCTVARFLTSQLSPYKLVGWSPMQLLGPCRGCRAGPCLHSQHKNHNAPPESEIYFQQWYPPWSSLIKSTLVQTTADGALWHLELGIHL